MTNFSFSLQSTNSHKQDSVKNSAAKDVFPIASALTNIQEFGTQVFKSSSVALQNTVANTSNKNENFTFSGNNHHELERPYQKQIWNRNDVANYLWLNSKAIIAEEMLEKVNTAATYLREIAFELGGIIADGDCFCNAFFQSYKTLNDRKIPFLDNTENKVSYLREVIASIIKHKSEQRGEKIKQNGEWITADEGDLLANLLSIPIRILTVNQNQDGC